MFKDMELSADIMRAYSATASGSKNRDGESSFDLSVSVLSQGNWPSYPPFPIVLPAALTSSLERFKAFYVSKHSGRTLSWAHGLDTCSLRAHFPSKGKGGGRKELLVSLAQAVVLLLFNDVGDGKLSVEEIGEATKLGQSLRFGWDVAGIPAADISAVTDCDKQRRKSSRARCSRSRAARCES